MKPENRKLLQNISLVLLTMLVCIWIGYEAGINQMRLRMASNFSYQKADMDYSDHVAIAVQLKNSYKLYNNNCQAFQKPECKLIVSHINDLLRASRFFYALDDETYANIQKVLLRSDQFIIDKYSKKLLSEIIAALDKSLILEKKQVVRYPHNFD